MFIFLSELYVFLQQTMETNRKMEKTRELSDAPKIKIIGIIYTSRHDLKSVVVVSATVC